MNSNKEINIWELGDRINVKLDISFIDLINMKIKEKFVSKREIYKKLIKYYKIPFSVFKNRIKRGYKYFIDLEIVLGLCKLLDINLYYMQQNILAYKTKRGWNYIENPKLPIKITPLFDMLVAHHIGDGTVINPKGNRKPYFGYRQFNKKYMSLYVKKIESVFGKINMKNEYKDKTRTYFPTVLSELLFKVYNLNTRSFLSKSARIPPTLFNKNKKFLLAFLLGIIIDDGYIDSTMIVIGLHNQNLAKDQKKVCDILGYKARYTERIGKNYENCGYVNILKEGLIKLWKDYNELKKEFTEVDLGYKGEQIKANLMISQRQIKRIPGNNKLILKLLSNKNLTVNEIAREILMTRQGVRYHIHKLEKIGKIKKIGTKGENNFIYQLNKKL